MVRRLLRNQSNLRGRVVANNKHSTKLKQRQKKSRFKRFLERIARASQQSDGKVCAA